eukprot:130277-Pelagomonas_calceolata.AAC.2
MECHVGVPGACSKTMRLLINYDTVRRAGVSGALLKATETLGSQEHLWPYTEGQRDFGRQEHREAIDCSVAVLDKQELKATEMQSMVGLQND